MFLIQAWKFVMASAAEFDLLGITIRLLFALIVGLVIGIDREMKRRVAGIKTHILVCLGAAMVMITSQYMMLHFGEIADPARMGAQVVSGVGFLGVGTIIVTGRNQVRGLTTAASIWVCACVGLAAGIGFIEGVILVLLFLVFTLKIIGKLDRVVQKRAREFDFYIEFKDNKGLTTFVDQMRESGYKIVRLQIGKCDNDEGSPNALVSIRVKGKENFSDFFNELRRQKYIKFVEEL